MISWFRSLVNVSPWPPHQSLDECVHLVAERSLETARARFSLDLSEMTVAERRGYVRARAHRMVRVQARRVAAERGISAESFDQLIMRALDRTAQLIVRQPLRQTVMPLPAAHVQLRIAG